jgi:hypothetical protein
MKTLLPGLMISPQVVHMIYLALVSRGHRNRMGLILLLDSWVVDRISPWRLPDAWDPWPDHNPIAQNININEAPQEGLGLDLNVAPDQQ